ncbi:MAG: hypothetical protein NC238_00680 [Dehalobacter sp.]|nr:hypothetical protein [Dehalobacter sp.]
MVAPFQPQQMQNKSFFQNLLGKQNARNSLIEINNLLSNTQDVKEVHDTDIKRINDSYGINVFSKFPDELALIYKLYFTHTLSDHRIDDSELVNLEHLKTIFKIDNVDSIHSQIIRAKLVDEIDKILVDKKVSPDEIQFLYKLIEDLKIPEDTVTKILSVKIKAILDLTLNRQISDRLITPLEKNELDELVKDLRFNIQIEEKSGLLYDQYRLAWFNNSRKQEIFGKGWTQLMKENTVTTVLKISWLTDEQKKYLIDNVIESYNQGESIAKLRDRIIQFIDLDKTTAKVFAETLYRDINNCTYLSIYRAQGANLIRFKASKKDLEWGPCRSLDGKIWNINSPYIIVPPLRPGCTCRLEIFNKNIVPTNVQFDRDLIKNYLEFHETYWHEKPT